MNVDEFSADVAIGHVCIVFLKQGNVLPSMKAY